MNTKNISKFIIFAISWFPALGPSETVEPLPQIGSRELPWLFSEVTEENDNVKDHETGDVGFSGCKIVISSFPDFDETIVFIFKSGEVILADRKGNSFRLEHFLISEELLDDVILNMTKSGVLDLKKSYTGKGVSDGIAIGVDFVLAQQIKSIKCDNFFPIQLRVFLNSLVISIFGSIPPQVQDDISKNPDIRNYFSRKVTLV